MDIKKYMVILLLLVTSISAQNVPLWKTDLGEPIKDYQFINEGKYIFFTSGEYVWCYEALSGKEVWQMEIEDFEEEGINLLLGEMFLTNSDNKLQAYDALTGKLLWENEYDDIDQSEYTEIFSIKNNAVFRYGDDHIGIDLNNGKELFRMEIDWWGELVDLGSFNYSVLESQNKMFVMEDGDKAVLFDVTTGKRLFENDNYDVNTDLIENGNMWFYETEDQKFLLTVLQDGVAVIDVENNKELMRKEFSIDGDFSVILPTNTGCAIMGEDKFVHFNFQTGKISEFDFPIDDIRSMQTYEIGDKSILIVSMENRLASLDLSESKVLWITKEDDPQFEGYTHSYLKSVGNNILLSYYNGSSDGSYIYLLSIDAFSGKVNYKKNTILSREYIPDFVRAIGNTIATISSALISVATLGNGSSEQLLNDVNSRLGYQNIGFEYDTFEYGDNIIFFAYGAGGTRVGTAAEMWNPATKEEPGQGFVSVNYKTGKINYQSFFSITEGLDVNKIKMLPDLLTNGNIVYKAGNERVIKFNLDTGKKLWEAKIPDKVITETTPINGILYLKVGVQAYYVSLKKDKIKLKETLDEDPFGFVAIDDASGKILWEIDINSDPVLLTPQFNISDYYNPKTNQLYFADLENLYALKMGKNGGKYAWKINFDDVGIGEYDYEETFAIIEKWIGSVPSTSSRTSYIGGGWTMTTTTTTGGYDGESISEFIDDASDASLTSTYTSWGNIWGVSAKNCLRILYGVDKTIIVGPEKIALINSNDGKIIWAKEWDYDNEEVTYVPRVLNGNIVYCMDEELVLIDLNTGKEIYRTEVDEKSKFFVAPNEKNIFNLYDEEISGYSLDSK